MDRDSMTFRRTDDDKKNGTTDLKMWNGEFELESGKLWMTGGEGARESRGSGGHWQLAKD